MEPILNSLCIGFVFTGANQSRGDSRATSAAREGPDRATGFALGASASMRPAMVRPVSCSIPLATDTAMPPNSPSCPVILLKELDGTARITPSALEIAVGRLGSSVQSVGSAMPGRYWEFSLAAAMASSRSVRPQSVTACPRSWAILARAVPQAPGPSTVIFTRAAYGLQAGDQG